MQHKLLREATDAVIESVGIAFDGVHRRLRELEMADQVVVLKSADPDRQYPEGTLLERRGGLWVYSLETGGFRCCVNGLCDFQVIQEKGETIFRFELSDHTILERRAVKPIQKSTKVVKALRKPTRVVKLVTTSDEASANA